MKKKTGGRKFFWTVPLRRTAIKPQHTWKKRKTFKILLIIYYKETKDNNNNNNYAK